MGDLQRNHADDVKGIVLTSSIPGIFSAGLELTELHNPDPQRIRKFWFSFQQVYLDWYGSRLPVVAAMEGHAPAAGCMLALCADYRIMSSPHKVGAADSEDPKKSSAKPPRIGLNESQLGIVAPPWLGQQMVDTVGRREAELALQLGTLYTPEQALEIGLIDRIVPSGEAVATALEVVQKQWMPIPEAGRFGSKRQLRLDRLNRLQNTRQEDIVDFYNFITQEEVQGNLSMYLKSLKEKKTK
jgi:Delta3-Delta2-enoyl-CoA isomerase